VVFFDQSTSVALSVWPPSGYDAIEAACRYVAYQLCADPAIALHDSYVFALPTLMGSH